MTTAAWITLATALLTLFLLVKTRIKMDAVFIMCMAILLFTGVLSEEQTFRGFVSRGALVIVFLGFVVAAMANTGALHWLSRQLLGKYVSMPRSLLRVTSLTALLSGFIPNVALGNIMYGSVNEWTHKNHIASSRLLLPVAYAVSFGSAMTVIGNSSNLIWSEMYTSITGNDMPFFAPLAACLACMVAGLVAIQLFRDRLTDHLNSEELADTFRDYCVELIVPSDSPLWGKTLSEAGIFAGEDFYLVKIQAFDNEVKEEDHIHPDIQVMGGDRLVFAGKLDAIRRIQQKWGLVVENDLNSKSSVLKKLTTHYQVAAIAPKSYLIGCRLSETQFEQRVFLGESIREVELQEGDMMVLHGAKLPWHRLTNVVISQTSSDVYSYDWHTIASSLILLAIILTSVFNLMPLMRAAFLGAIVTSLMGNFQNKNRWSGINWTLVTVIAGSQALGEAVHTSGLSDVASDLILSLCGSSPVTAIIFITAISIVLTQVLYDNTAVVLMLPIALDMAVDLGCNPLPFAVAVMLAVASNFCTPFSTGHITNVMVRGQYSRSELWRYGWPFALIMFVVIVLSVTLFYPFH